MSLPEPQLLPLFDDVPPYRRLIQEVSQVVIGYYHAICFLCKLQYQSVGTKGRGNVTRMEQTASQKYLHPVIFSTRRHILATNSSVFNGILYNRKTQSGASKSLILSYLRNICKEFCHFPPFIKPHLKPTYRIKK